MIDRDCSKTNWTKQQVTRICDQGLHFLLAKNAAPLHRPTFNRKDKQQIRQRPMHVQTDLRRTIIDVVTKNNKKILTTKIFHVSKWVGRGQHGGVRRSNRLLQKRQQVQRNNQQRYGNDGPREEYPFIPANQA
jgi:hypothetical protein